MEYEHYYNIISYYDAAEYYICCENQELRRT